jgi:hypothetical protein
MFSFALFLGLYTYVLFFLGIIGFLYKPTVIICTILIFSVYFFLQRRNIQSLFINVKLKRKRVTLKTNEGRLRIVLVSLLVLQALINLIGALSPELGFDALWYHLTLPKLYLLNHSIYHIFGGLLYYSDMPKLGELLYVGMLSFGNETLVKLLHFSFGLLSAAALYFLARKFFTPFISLLTVVIFYSNLVVAWESTTAYVDLIRTFFEIMALWCFINWHKVEKQKWFYLSAVMVGLAIMTKLLAVGSLIIFAVLILLSRQKWRNISTLRDIIIFWVIALVIPIPWFIFSYLHTGNPVYPFFSTIYQIAPEPLSLGSFFASVWVLFTHASDPISPFYIMLLPIIILFFPKMKKEIKFVAVYSVLAIIVWYFTPRTGGGRFILPYLPAFSIVCAAVFDVLIRQKKQFGIGFSRYVLIMLIIISAITMAYRFVAERKYIPVLIGKQSKQDFLKNNLNFSYGDFYDTDNYFKKNIKPTDNVLLYGFHNLYYVDFPFIDSSWAKRGDSFNYIAVQNGTVPDKYKNWQLIYKNDKTMVKLYKSNASNEFHSY